MEEPLMNQIDVKITYACNFKCEYCYQTDENGCRQQGMLSLENVNNLLKFIDLQGKKFLVTLAGGEPFVYPYLLNLAEGLAQRNCKIMIVTNFSASMEQIYQLLSVCGEALAIFNISAHLSQWDSMELFYNKLKQFDEMLHSMNLKPEVWISCVVTEDNFDMVKSLETVISRGFSNYLLYLQRVYYHGVYHVYNEEMEAFLKGKGINVPVGRANSIDFYGRYCWGGSRFFYIESDGEVRRCYTRQENETMWRLGNLKEYKKIRFFNEPVPCLSCDAGNCVCYENFEKKKFVLNESASDMVIDKYLSI